MDLMSYLAQLVSSVPQPAQRHPDWWPRLEPEGPSGMTLGKVNSRLVKPRLGAVPPKIYSTDSVGVRG